MRKNSFFTFCFALIPGGGEMYLGMMKKGLVLMLTFWGICSVAALLQLEFLLFVLPVVWFYSFFETLNANNMTVQERQIIDDRITFTLGNSASEDLHRIVEKRHALIGGCLVAIGIWLMIRTSLYALPNHLIPQWLWELLRRIPSLAVYVAIIVLGVYLVRGKKKTQLEEDYVAYKGEQHEQ